MARALGAYYRSGSAHAKSALLQLGRVGGTGLASRVRHVGTYLELGAWAKASGSATDTFPRREDLFRIGVNRLSSAARPLYLEFGVYEGVSLGWWLSALTSPQARFFGFDSFEGLPHQWDAGMAKGEFATAVPSLNDPRLEFVIGWFEKTVPDFTAPNHDALFITVDADLYSSATTVLEGLNDLIVPGTLIYFDEFPEGEYEALRDWCSKNDRLTKPLAVDKSRRAWLVEVEA